MSVSDNQDNSHIEDILTPPKYDGLWVVMSIIAALITSVVSGTIILIAAYVSIGNFSLESGVSPILLALITFFWLTIGNILYYILLSKVFPHIYTRGRTAIAQLAIMSILLYIFFAPVYVIVSTTLLDTDGILVAFWVHIVINTFALQLVMGITANYRYSLLSLYANIVSLLISSLIMFSVFVSFSDSGTALFLLLGLVIVAQVIGTTCSHGIAWIYAHIYSVTGYDPIGSVFSRIEQEEKSLEQEAEKLLTQFPQK